MSKRSIVMLGVLTLILMVVALLFTPQRPGRSLEDAGLLLPELRYQVNELTAFDLSAGDGRRIAELRREQTGWVVLNRNGFEADFRRVQEFLRELALAQLIEPRTARPEMHARLGLADIGAPDGSGVLVEFPGTELPAIILGSQDSITGTRFVRLQGQAQSWLSDRALVVGQQTFDWLERSVMDIPASELAELSIEHPDGERVLLRPADEEGDQWVLLDVPEGREAAPRWEIRPVANGLANIVLSDVRRHGGEIPADAVRSSYLTRDGLRFVASLFSDDAGNWVHFSVSVAEPEGLDEGADEAHQALVIDALAVDARLSPWQFALDQRKFEIMSRRLEDLLVPIAD